MAKSNNAMSAQILYGDDMFDVTLIEYCEWEDRLDAAKVEPSSPEGLWITYDFLFDLGHFVPKPKVKRPSKASPKPKKKVHPNAPKAKEVLDSWEERSNPREPAWTQSRILAERDKLLNQKEKLLEKKAKELLSQSSKPNITIAQQAQFYNDDGTPYSTGNYVSAIMGLVFIIFVMLCCSVALIN